MSLHDKSLHDCRILVAGNSVLDVLVRDASGAQGVAQDAWEGNVQLLSRPVEAVLGGGGASAVSMLGRLGQSVALSSNLGCDAWATVLGGWFREASVEVLGSGAGATGVNVIHLTPEGRRQSSYFAGDRVDWRRKPAAFAPEWFFAPGYGAVGPDDGESLLDVFSRFRATGTQVMFDPSPWFANRIASADMHALWGQVSCLVGTEDELMFWMPESSIEKLATRLLECGPESVVIKRGAGGAYYAAAGGQCGHVPVEEVEHSNTIGAGDTFNGRLLFGLSQRESLPAAVVSATTLATRAVRNSRGVLGRSETLRT